MRTTIAKVSIALGAVCLLGISLYAQGYQAYAKVPFSFQVAGTILPAGDYRLENAAPRSTAFLRNLKTGRAIFLATSAGELNTTQRSAVVFHRYGEEYFLAEIRAPYGFGSAVNATAREKELKKSSKPVETAVVSITLRAD